MARIEHRLSHDDGEQPRADRGDDNGYLRRLGERVREARARRGMTRKGLAQQSGVSERYLAQLESGKGNISIVLLRSIARAMNVPIVDLVREGPDRPVELTLLLQFLERLGPQDIREAHRALSTHFGAGAGHNRQHRIALIGLRGAGKTTLGRKLAERLDWPFVELGKEIERESGISLSEIFSLYGQAAYRRYERRALERILESHQRVVIATGGGLVAEPGTFELLLHRCYTIWLRARPEDHMGRVMQQGDFRPMGGNPEAMEDLRRILEGREQLYASADAVVDTSGRTADACLAELAAVVEAAAAQNE